LKPFKEFIKVSMSLFTPNEITNASERPIYKSAYCFGGDEGISHRDGLLLGRYRLAARVFKIKKNER
jgi:hypothetical protein